MPNHTKKYLVLDDSYGEIQGQVMFESDDRAEAWDFYNAYEKERNNVALLTRNPDWIMPA